MPGSFAHIPHKSNSNQLDSRNFILLSEIHKIILFTIPEISFYYSGFTKLYYDSFRSPKLYFIHFIIRDSQNYILRDSHFSQMALLITYYIIGHLRKHLKNLTIVFHFSRFRKFYYDSVKSRISILLFEIHTFRRWRY